MTVKRLYAVSALSLVLAQALSACASNRGAQPSYQPKDTSESRALQLVRSADLLGLRDADAPKDTRGPGNSSTLPLAALYGGLNTLRPPPGFSHGAAGALGFTAMFISGPAPEELSRTSKILVWMPRDKAASAEEAWRKIDDLVQRELAAVLLDTEMPPGYRLEKETRQVTVYRPGSMLAPTPYRSDEVTWRIRGGDCDDPKVLCRYRASLPVPPVEGTAPAVLGGYPAWSFVRTEGMASVSASFVDRRSGHDTPRAVFPDLEVLRKLSTRLPSWVALYLAPNTTAYRDEQTGKPVLLSYPVVLRGGEPLHFVHGG